MSFFGSQRVVQDSTELRRVLALPRVTFTDPQVQTLVEQYTAFFRTPNGTGTLRPIQAKALHSIRHVRGGFCPIRVGGGKTLLSFLIPHLFPESKRPLLLLPAGLIGKTLRERDRLAKDWKIATHLRIMSYNMLGTAKHEKDLDFYSPDLIIADEAHRLKNERAGVTRRVHRYMAKEPSPGCTGRKTPFVAMSGTLMRKSIQNFAQLLRWSHKELAPVPLDKGNTIEWAGALDDPKNQQLGQSYEPGPLLRLATREDWDKADGDETRAARLGFQRRLLETPGVVASDGSTNLACSLYIRALPYEVNQVTEDNFARLRGKWQTPDGWTFSEALILWAAARQLALGLHYMWDPRPPDEWLEARGNWARFVRETLKYSRHLDTELQVSNAIREGRLTDAGEYEAWAGLRPTYVPRARPEWHDASALEACERWIKAQGSYGGIIWTEHEFFARELERRTECRYFGAQGLDRRGAYIEDAKKGEIVIASIHANSTGRNLQTLWNRNLITSCPPSGETWEQLLGRTHREGQEADEVEVDCLFGCWEHHNGITGAVSEARTNADILGQDQKLLLADLDFPSEGEVLAMAGKRWAKNVREKG